MNRRATTGGDMRDNLLIVGVIIAAVVIFLWLSSLERERSLRQSAVGFDALAIWLQNEGAPARTVAGWERIEAWTVGLRILPLFDVELDAERDAPNNVDALLQQESEIDFEADTLREKIDLLSTLVVLPKWRSAVRLTGVAHPDLLNDEARVQTLLDELVAGSGELQTLSEPFRNFSAEGVSVRRLDVTLYQPRVLKGSDCQPYIGDADAMILGYCQVKEAPQDAPGFWLLTDPDLLNAHGLRLGDNAAAAKEIIKFVSENSLTVIDYTTWIWADRSDNRGEREWSDLLRFFEYPFGAIWAGLAATTALMLWRGGVRFGAPVRIFADGPQVAKSVSVEASARLLRLSGHDLDLVSAFVKQRLQFAVGEIFGPRARGETDSLTQLLNWLTPRDEALARLLERAVDRTGREDALLWLDEFETTLQKVLDEFGRTPRRG